jgi:hypothetical protein
LICRKWINGSIKHSIEAKPEPISLKNETSDLSEDIGKTGDSSFFVEIEPDDDSSPLNELILPDGTIDPDDQAIPDEIIDLDNAVLTDNLPVIKDVEKVNLLDPVNYEEQAGEDILLGINQMGHETDLPPIDLTISDEELPEDIFASFDEINIPVETQNDTVQGLIQKDNAIADNEMEDIFSSMVGNYKAEKETSKSPEPKPFENNDLTPKETINNISADELLNGLENDDELVKESYIPTPSDKIIEVDSEDLPYGLPIEQGVTVDQLVSFINSEDFEKLKKKSLVSSVLEPPIEIKAEEIIPVKDAEDFAVDQAIDPAGARFDISAINEEINDDDETVELIDIDVATQALSDLLPKELLELAGDGIINASENVDVSNPVITEEKQPPDSEQIPDVSIFDMDTIPSFQTVEDSQKTAFNANEEYKIKSAFETKEEQIDKINKPQKSSRNPKILMEMLSSYPSLSLNYFSLTKEGDDLIYAGVNPVKAREIADSFSVRGSAGIVSLTDSVFGFAYPFDTKVIVKKTDSLPALLFESLARFAESSDDYISPSLSMTILEKNITKSIKILENRAMSIYY